MTNSTARPHKASEADKLSPEQTDINSARALLHIESGALEALAAGLDKSFSAAVSLMSDIRGRVIVTGMGKNAHIGCKIASTMASTGTPAYFVHPGEASHGDLGMIVEGDVILALSNSGETAELADLVAHASRFSIPLIAITGKPESTLALAASVALILPDSPEACPMGLAPTTSTTVTLALGDALAVALLERKNFSPADFHVLHPGGKLGRRLLKVRDLMHVGDELPLSPASTLMSEAILQITAKSFGCLGIVDADGRIAGVITDGDLRRHMSADLLNQSARDIMTDGVRSIGPDVLASQALALMNSMSITTLFVVEEDHPVGILHIHDCLRAGVA